MRKKKGKKREWVDEGEKGREKCGTEIDEGFMSFVTRSTFFFLLLSVRGSAQQHEHAPNACPFKSVELRSKRDTL